MVRRISKAIARLLSLALDLDVDYFDKTEMLGKPIATMRLLRYQGNVFSYAVHRALEALYSQCYTYITIGFFCYL